MKARVLRIFPFTWFTLGGLLIASRCQPTLLQAAKAVIAMCAIATSVYVFNDVMDLRLDKINKVFNPLTQGKVSKNEAISLAFISAAIGMLFSYAINLAAFMLGSICLILGFTYSSPQTYLKKRFPVKMLIGPTGVAIAYLFGGASVGVFSPILLYAVGLMFCATLAVNPIVDLPDIKGDAKRRCKTLAVVLGPTFTIKFAIAVLLSVAVTISLYSYLFGLGLALPLLADVFCLSLVLVIYPLLNPRQPLEYVRGVIKKMIFIYSLFPIALIFTAI